MAKSCGDGAAKKDKKDKKLTDGAAKKAKKDGEVMAKKKAPPKKAPPKKK